MDGNSCTKDFCLNGDCVNVPENGSACALELTVTSPLRAESLLGPGDVAVAGKVTSPAGSIASVMVNGVVASVDGNGEFNTLIPASVGVNILHAVATDEFNRVDSVAQSFVYSGAYYAPGSPTNVPTIDAGSGFWLDNVVFDDNDTSDLDDMTTAAWVMMENFDINAVIPDPLFAEGSQPGFGWCTWEVGVSQVAYKVSNLDLIPIQGGMSLQVVFSDFSAYVSAEADNFCPNAKGYVFADQIVGDATLSVTVNASHQIEVKISTVEVNITGVEVVVEEGVTSLFNWVIDWFEDDLAVLMGDQLEAVITAQVAPLIDGMLSELADYQAVFPVPSLVPGGAPLFALNFSFRLFGFRFR